MIRWKTLPWVLGVALLAVSLVAARLNTEPTSHGGGPAAQPTTAPVGGMTVIGTVGTLPDVLALNAPGVLGMPAVTVKKVHVKEGATVAVGDVLVEFDDAAFAPKIAQAEHLLTVAQWQADEATKKRDDHKLLVEKADLAVKKAETELRLATEARDRISEALEKTFTLKLPGMDRPPNEEEKVQRRRENLDLLKAEGAIELARIAVDNAKIDRKRLDNDPVEAEVQQANAQVAIRQAQVGEAKAVVESFKLKAQMAGTVEQITVAEGMTLGPATRTPVMYLIPNGPRVVRAEVEAEFAHKIDAFVGKPVTIRAGDKFNDTYAGVARRASGAFLPKRFGGDSLVNSPPRSLECTIDVTDPAPPGKPPLRPGQPVRVEFGQ